MAGDWLKFECSLPEKPETLAITVAMGWDDPDATVGKLMRFFRWFDQHTTNGNAVSVTPALLDRLIGVTGFCKAIADVGWLLITEHGLSLNNFEKHNGATAKSRAQTAKRVAGSRSNAKCNAETVTNNVTTPLAREEKNKEELKQERDLTTAREAVPVDNSNSTPPPEIRDDDKFRMHVDWQPGPSFATYATLADIDAKSITPLELTDFRRFWAAEHREHTQSQWENKLLTSLKNQRSKNPPQTAANGPPKAIVPDELRQARQAEQEYFGDLASLRKLYNPLKTDAATQRLGEEINRVNMKYLVAKQKREALEQHESAA